jgi:hypothetical protein
MRVDSIWREEFREIAPNLEFEEDVFSYFTMIKLLGRGAP